MTTSLDDGYSSSLAENETAAIEEYKSICKEFGRLAGTGILDRYEEE